MPSKVKYEVVASNGTYKDRDGNEKKRYLNCGKVFENESGHLSIKLESIPVSPEWSGWFSLFEPKEQGRDRTPQDGYRAGTQAAHQQSKQNAYQPEDDGDSDDIPF